MEEAQRLSSNPAERAHAALGLSMVRFLAADLPAASPPARTCSRRPTSSTGSCASALEFQAAATRMVGGLPSAETFGRMLALEPEVSRGETAAERSLLALIALVFAATTARTGRPGRGARGGGVGRRAAPRRGPLPAPRAGGARDDDRDDGRHHRDGALGPADEGDRGVERGGRGGTDAQLDAPLLQLARPARLGAGVEGRSRRRRGRRRHGPADAPRRRSDHPPERAVRARRRPHRARRARAGRGAGARRLADGRAAAVAEHEPGARLPRPARTADGRPGAPR